MNVLVTGGGTSAPIDDVRSITNVSTGRFAAAISESCLARGACVWHLHAPGRSFHCFAWHGSIWRLDDLAREFDRLRSLHDEWTGGPRSAASRSSEIGDWLLNTPKVCTTSL